MIEERKEEKEIIDPGKVLAGQYVPDPPTDRGNVLAGRYTPTAPTSHGKVFAGQFILYIPNNVNIILS